MSNTDFLWSKKNIVVWDGGTGTLLQQQGLQNRECPESWNLIHPDKIEMLHAAYIEAGAQVITTNTFGAGNYKLAQFGLAEQQEQIIRQGVNLARAAVRKAADDHDTAVSVLVAYSLGPSGCMLQPFGDLSFDDAYELFRQQVVIAEQAGADLVICETHSDMAEIRAALLAVKENTSLPAVCSLTFQEDGRTLMGTDAVTAVNVLQNMGADAVGSNCSGGPEQLLSVMQTMAEFARIPLIVMPNAGLPFLENGRTVFPLQPEEFASWARHFADCGVTIIGGCCGTTPEHIRQLKEEICRLQSAEHSDPLQPSVDEESAAERCSYVTALSSATRTVLVGGEQPVRVVGERINPTGKKKLSQHLREGNLNYITEEAIKQVKNGAQLLDINVGIPEADEAVLMRQVVQEVQNVVNVPLVLDSGDVKALEQGLRYCQGRPLINSVNGRRVTMDNILPLAKKYGACVLGLAMDENGIPALAEERLAIAERIVRTAEEFGLRRQDILIDCLTLTVSAQQKEAIQTVKALRMVKEKLGCATVLGVSNISFGLPQRGLLNSTFLAMAISSGLDLPIINPNLPLMMDTVMAAEVLTARDPLSQRYIAAMTDRQDIQPIPAVRPAEKPAAAKEETSPASETTIKTIAGSTAAASLYQQIIDGDRLQAKQTSKLLLQEQMPLLEIVNKVIVPALEEVGIRYELGRYFLPQLLLAADTVQNVFALLKQQLGSAVESSGRKIILATVYGDVHDIGKNIVRVLLENYGYEVIDLGKDVPPQVIVDRAVADNIRLVGLSALMTTTLPAMQETIRLLREQAPDCLIMVGGAVLTPEYAKKIGADFYSSDARGSVRIAQEVWK